MAGEAITHGADVAVAAASGIDLIQVVALLAAGVIAVPTLLVLQSVIMHIFPTTQNLPKIVARKLEQKANAEAVAVDAPAPAAEPPARVATAAAVATAPVARRAAAKAKRAPRKAATLPTP